VGGLGGPRAGVDGLCRLCCDVAVGGAVYWRPAISLPAQSIVVGEVGRCVGVRWRADVCVGVLQTGPVAAGVRVYSSVSHL
jgi:hypothetical protein